MTYRDYNSIQISRELLTYIFNKVVVASTGYKTPCWVRKRRQDDYSQLKINRTDYAAHRLMYALFVEKVDPVLHIDHLCRVKACIHPGHLEQVTQRENILRGISPLANNARKTHCIHGHPLVGENVVVSIRKNGHPRRKCRECTRERIREKHGFKPRRDNSTHCRNGHPYTSENLYVHNGTKTCRICRREQERQRSASNKAHRGRCG